jgi:cell wall assembly regulator SMI1
MLRPDRMYYLYQMLTKLFLYRKAKSSNAELILIVIELPESVRSRFSSHDRGQERLSSQFAPAVANKLLRIEKIKYEEDKLIEFIKNSSNKRVN